MKKFRFKHSEVPQCVHFRIKKFPVPVIKVVCPDCGQLTEIKHEKS